MNPYKYFINQAASVFVLYATSSANTVAKENNRKTITGGDVVTAMGEMEFDKFVRPLENSLASMYSCTQRWNLTKLIFQVWRRGQKDKKDLAAKKKASALAKTEDESAVPEKDNNDVIEID